MAAARPRRPSGRVQNEVTAGDFFDADLPTCGINEAIAALHGRGGRVRIPAGRWRLTRSIYLPRGVSLVGDGPSTQIHILPLKVAQLAKNVRKGGHVLTLRGRVAFEVGQQIGVSGDLRVGYRGTHGLVTRIEGHRVWLSSRFNHALSVWDHAKAVNLFPAITAEGESDLEVMNLSIVGPNAHSSKRWDYTYSGVHLDSCRRARLINISVRGWPSDGISVQRGSDVQVSHCQAHDCRGHGYHPGGGLGRSIWSHNIGKGNGADGFYFCARVHHSVCSDSVFSDNGRSGIGGVGSGGDHHNVISDNVCSYNQQWGIDAYEGDEQVISGNICLSNSRKKPSAYGGIRLHDMQRVIIQGNRCADDQKRPTQTRGIVESGESDHNLISGNLCAGMKEAVTVIAPHSLSTGNLH